MRRLDGADGPTARISLRSGRGPAICGATTKSLCGSLLPCARESRNKVSGWATPAAPHVGAGWQCLLLDQKAVGAMVPCPHRAAAAPARAAAHGIARGGLMQCTGTHAPAQCAGSTLPIPFEPLASRESTVRAGRTVEQVNAAVARVGSGQRRPPLAVACVLHVSYRAAWWHGCHVHVAELLKLCA